MCIPIPSLAACVLAALPGGEDPLPIVTDVELQPLAAATARLIEALDYLGTPLAAGDADALQRILADPPADAVQAVQHVLDGYCIAGVNVNAEARVKVRAGPAPRRLVRHGWRTFLVKVHNEAGVTARLGLTSPQAAPVYRPSDNTPAPPAILTPGDVTDRWLDAAVYRGAPLRRTLSGLELEYCVVQLYSRDAGKREATLAFDVGQGTQDIGFRNEVPLLFECAPAVAVTLEVLDFDGSPTTAAFDIRDPQGLVYPTPAKRLAPDFFFHPQIYRASGESVVLAPGPYDVVVTRGPEYVPLARRIEVPAAEQHRESFRLERWVHAAREGWRSGDHHVHAAGCSHYDDPSQGVTPEDMMRHVLGEDLNVGCVLSWGPCWYYQKEFFEGEVHPLSTDDYVLRYDVEVSGFPSSFCGHLSLLRLREDDYEGVETIEEWPSWDLPVLQWAQAQDAVAGFSHSGWGLQVSCPSLPCYEVPPFDGIGANEYVVDVAHGAVDFISTVDTPAIWELSIWYHTLNCGFRTRISGETDFPCIYGERVGLGRSYVKLPPGPLDFDAWAEGIRDGRAYVSDGMSHLFDFTVGGVAVGEPGPGGAVSQLELAAPGPVEITARVAARLDPNPDPGLRARPLDEKPYWHLERARLGDGRRVPVELVVNGVAVARREVEADGELRPIAFEHELERSSWVALRIFPSSHTNPVFVEVGGKPIRASRRSARWCLESVDVCWDQKHRGIRESERAAAEAAYEHARESYRRILAECEVE